jgi:hypothetical protein
VKINKNHQKNIKPVEINDESKQLSISEIFSKINLNKEANTTNVGRTIKSENQEYVIFNEINLQIEETEKPIEEKLENFQFDIKPKFRERKIKFNLHKPKIQTKILSVIKSCSNVVLGLGWFNLSQGSNISNGQPKSKLLLVVNDDGYISIYGLKSADYEIEATINLNQLKSIPFESFSEEWISLCSIFSGSPIRDFYISNNPRKMYTLHVDNYVLTWILSFRSNKLSLIASYGINITPNLIVDKILVDIYDRFIYTFHSDCVKIFKILDLPPFPLVYTKNFTDLEIENCKIKEHITQEDLNVNNYLNFSENEEDLIDYSENVKLQEINFFYNVQKPGFSLLEEFIAIPVYLVAKKNYFLFKFNNKEFNENICRDIDYLKTCFNGQNQNLLTYLYNSNESISFVFSPFFYFKMENIPSFTAKNYNSALETELNITDIAHNYYQALLIINSNTIKIYNINKNKNISCYEMIESKIKSQELLIVNWMRNNTVLFSSQKILMNLIKFCNETENLGFPISSSKIEEYTHNLKVGY